MMRRIGATDWMWAHACDLLADAERMHRQFFRVAASPRATMTWEPPADVYENDREVLVMVAMPGVTADHVEVRAEGGVLVIRAKRPTPLAASRLAVRQLEIPYGVFERRIAMPAGLFELEPPELSHGCLVVRLRKR